MAKILFSLVFAIEIFALGNRGGGPLLSHLFLTGVTFLALCFCLWRKPEFKFRFTPAHFSYALFFLFFAISLVTSLTPEFGLAELLLFANAGILFLIFSSLKLEEKELEWFSTAFIALAVVDTLIGYFIYTKMAYPRFGATFIDLKESYTSFSNDFGNFLLLVLPLAIHHFFKKHERIGTTILSCLAVCILLSGFLLSFSRGAWISALSLIVLSVSWGIIHKNKITTRARNASVSEASALTLKFFAMRLISIIVVTTLLVSALQFTRGLRFPVTPLLLKATFQADEGGASIEERLQFWRGAVRIIKDRPIFGGGVLSFKYLYPKYQEEFGVNWDHPHNIFLKIGVENGIFAVLFFALFLILVAVTALKFLWRNPWHPKLFLFLGALGALGHNLVDFNFIVSNFIIFIIFTALLINTPALNPQRSTLIPRFLFIASLCLLLLGLHEGFYNIDFKKGRTALEEGRLDEAVQHFTRAQKLFFKRDLVHYIAAAYEKELQATGNKAWDDFEHGLIAANLTITGEMLKTTRELSTSSVDAGLIAKEAEIFMRDKFYSHAQLRFSLALKLDPMNKFHYYYGLLQAQKAQGKPIDPKVREKVLVLLEEYKPFLRKNRHMTVLTDNPSYAVALYKMFGMKGEVEELQKIWFEESVKFSVKYGPLKLQP